MPLYGHRYSASTDVENMAGLSGGTYQNNPAGALSPNVDTHMSSPVSPGSHVINPSAFETPQRRPVGAPPYTRRTEELHLPSNSAVGQPGSRDPTRQHSHQSSHDYQTPGINVQQATPQGPQYANPPASLQAGRPGASTSMTAPSTIPTLPHIQNPHQQQASSSRPSTANTAHNYSRSSPTGMDQPKYTPFLSTPENSKFQTPPGHSFAGSQSGQAETVFSPLGLADIRSQQEMDGPQNANPYSNDGIPAFPTNSNYIAPYAVYALDWCKWPVQQHNKGDSAGKMALGSYVEDGHNYIQILDTHIVPEGDFESPDELRHGLEYTKTAEATHGYPVTRILWEPASSQKQSTDLLATSGDHLRLWSLPTQPSHKSGNSITRSANTSPQTIQKLTPLALLSNSKSPEHTAPLTSLDWNTLSPSLIITSSIDTTCTIWDIPTLTAKTQLIAHDKEVFDVRFCANSVDVFVSCGADGSVRMFDLRSLEHSTIIYEPSEKTNDKTASPGNMSPTAAQQTMSYSPPLLRLAASPHDAHLLATFSQDSNSIRILDVRQPGQALLELKGHSAAINCIEWSPSRRGTLASGGDDSLVLIWDLLNQSSGSSSSQQHHHHHHHHHHRNSSSNNASHSHSNSKSNSAALVPNGSTTTSSSAHPTSISTTSSTGAQSPIASWQCEYEVSNISWAPQSGLTASQGNDWLGVSGARSIWGVSL